MNNPMTASTDLVRAFYDKLGQGDVPGLLGLFAPEIAWTEAERFPYFSGTWTRPQQILENLLMPIGRDWNGFSARADSFVTEGDTVVAIGGYHGVNKHTGKTMDAPFAHVWTVANGKIASFLQYTDTALVLEATTS